MSVSSHGTPSNLASLRIKPAEEALFSALFSSMDSAQEGSVSGKQVFQLFMGSKLDKKVLAEIWNIATKGKHGLLGKDGFFVACRLIAIAQAGHPVSLASLAQFTEIPLPQFGEQWAQYYSKTLPEASASQETNSGINWGMSAQELEKYSVFFSQADMDGDGFVNGKEAKAFFSQSQLSSTILGSIWLLSDVDKDNRLSKSEFCLAMHFIMKIRSNPNVKLPTSLPEDLMPIVSSVGVSDFEANPSALPEVPSFNRTFPSETIAPSSEKSTGCQTEFFSILPLMQRQVSLPSGNGSILSPSALEDSSIRSPESERLAKEISTRKKELEAMRYEVEKTKKEKQHVDDQIQFYQNQMSSLKIQYDEYTRIVKDNAKEVNSEKEQLELLKSKIDQMKADIQSQSGSLNASKEKLSALREERKYYENLFEETKEMLSKEDSSLSMLEKEQQTLKNEIANLSDLVKSQQLILEDKRTQRESLQKEHETLREKLKSLSTELQNSRDEVTLIATDIAEKTEIRNNLRKQVDEESKKNLTLPLGEINSGLADFSNVTSQSISVSSPVQAQSVTSSKQTVLVNMDLSFDDAFPDLQDDLPLDRLSLSTPAPERISEAKFKSTPNDSTGNQIKEETPEFPNDFAFGDNPFEVESQNFDLEFDFQTAGTSAQSSPQSQLKSMSSASKIPVEDSEMTIQADDEFPDFKDFSSPVAGSQTDDKKNDSPAAAEANPFEFSDEGDFKAEFPEGDNWGF